MDNQDLENTITVRRPLFKFTFFAFVLTAVFLFYQTYKLQMQLETENMYSPQESPLASKYTKVDRTPTDQISYKQKPNATGIKTYEEVGLFNKVNRVYLFKKGIYKTDVAKDPAYKTYANVYRIGDKNPLNLENDYLFFETPYTTILNAPIIDDGTNQSGGIYIITSTIDYNNRYLLLTTYNDLGSESPDSKAGTNTYKFDIVENTLHRLNLPDLNISEKDKFEDDSTYVDFGEFDPEINYVVLEAYNCWECMRSHPVTLILDLTTNEIKLLGKVVGFNWNPNSSYTYAEYVEKECDNPDSPFECHIPYEELPEITESF